MDDNRYFSRSWDLLTHDKGWVKPLLVMMCSSLVPIVGELGNTGYALEWARLTAWGVDASPKQKNVDVGACIASGWRGFLVELGWSLLIALGNLALIGFSSAVPGAIGELISLIVGTFYVLVGIAWHCATQVAQIRAAIYERAGAGYRFDRVFEMVNRDRNGFGRLFVISLVASLMMSAIGVAIAIVIVLELTPAFIFGGYMGDSYSFLSALSGSLVWLVLTVMIFSLGVSFLANGMRLLTLTATALWMRQFDVANWGRSEDPLPQGTTGMDDAMPNFPQGVTPRQHGRDQERGTTTVARNNTVYLAEPTAEPAPEAPREPLDEKAVDELYTAAKREAADAPIEEQSVEELLGDLDRIVSRNGGDSTE